MACLISGKGRNRPGKSRYLKYGTGRCETSHQWRPYGVCRASGVAKVSGAPVQSYVPEHLAPLVQIGVVNFKEVRGMHLNKFGFGNGISRMFPASLIDKMFIINKIVTCL